MEPRSRRQQSQQQSRRSIPTQPQPQAPASQCSSSLSSVSSINSAVTQQSSTMLQPQQGSLMSAPLPSPSAQPSSYFPQQQQHQQQAPTSHPSQTHGISQGQLAERHMGERGGGGGAPETASFLKDFNLLAEAAKRAQMACLTRDLGDVDL